MATSEWQFLGGINPRTVVAVMSAALTPTIALVAAYVAYQQWRINRTQLNLNLYDRRLAIYKALDAFYGEVATLGTAKYSIVFDLRSKTAEAVFLFPADIEKHLAEVYIKGMRLAALHELMYPSSGDRGLPVGEERSKVAHEEGDLVL